MSSYEGCHFAGDWVVICVGPDVCKLVNGTPVPYMSVAFGKDATNNYSRVNFTSTNAFHSPSFTLCCLNNEQGVGGGVISEVNKGVCYELSHSTSVNVGGAPAIRDGDLFWVNAKSRKEKANAIGIVKYLAIATFVEFAEALKEGTDELVRLLEMVDPRFGPALKAPPQKLDAKALEDCWQGIKDGGVGALKSEAFEYAGGAMNGPAGEVAAKVNNTGDDIGGFLDDMASGHQSKALCATATNILGGYVINRLKKVRVSRGRGKGRKKGGKRKPSAAETRKRKRKLQGQARRINRRK